MQDISAVILAGGQSKRMGCDKAQLLWQGKTFLENLLQSMDGVFQEKWVIGRKRDFEFAALAATSGEPYTEPQGVGFSEDVRPGAGPLGGIYTGLLLSRSPWAVFVACDTPLLDIVIYEKLAKARDAEGRNIIFFKTPSDAWGNMPLLIPRSYLRIVRMLLDAGEKSVRSLLQRAVVRGVEVQAHEEHKIRSINTPQDFQEILGGPRVLVA